MSKKKAKKKFNVEDVLRALQVLRACNKLDLRKLDFVDDNGNTVEPVYSATIYIETNSKGETKREEIVHTLEEEIDHWRFTGLGNYTFIEMNFARSKSFGKKYRKLGN